MQTHVMPSLLQPQGAQPWPMQNMQQPELPQLSGYVHSHPVAGEVVGLYTPFNHEVTFLPARQWEAVKSGRYAELPPAVYQDLVARQFLVPNGFDERALQGYAAPAQPGFVSLWLLVVKTCNMACRYCVVDAEEQTKQLAATKEQNTPKATRGSGGRDRGVPH